MGTITEALTRTAGQATLTVANTGETTAEGRQVWSWTVAEGEHVLGRGEDLYTGVGARATPEEVLGTLCSFLSAAAESADYAMRHGVALDETENADLFNHNVLMLASQESDEIAMLGAELEGDWNA